MSSTSPVTPATDPVLESLDGTLRLLRRTVGYAEATAMALDPDALLPTQFTATVPLIPELALLACRNEQQADDLFKFKELARARSHVATLSADHDTECATSERWQKLLLPRGRRHELRAALVDAQGSCWGAMALYRRDRLRFSPSDIRVTEGLLPARASHLARSMVAVRAPGTPFEPTFLLIDEAGTVVSAPDSACRWLDEIRRSDTLDRVGMLLASLAAHIRRARDDGEEQHPVRVRMRSAGGAWTTLIAEPLRGDQEGWKIPVVVMATDPSQLFPLEVAAFGLTEREAEVVLRVVEGLHTKAIADRLSISVLTVQDHLKSVFEKTGVHSRREMAYLLCGAPLQPT